MLFYPWQNEKLDLLKGHKTYKDHFETVMKKVQSKK